MTSRRKSRRHPRSRYRSRCRRVKSGPRKGRCYKKSRRASRSRRTSRGRRSPRRRMNRSRSKRCRRVKSGPRKGRCYKKSRKRSRVRRIRYQMGRGFLEDLKRAQEARETRRTADHYEPIVQNREDDEAALKESRAAIAERMGKFRHRPAAGVVTVPPLDPPAGAVGPAVPEHDSSELGKLLKSTLNCRCTFS